MGFVLSGPYVNHQNNANAAVKFTNSHLLRVESHIHENIKTKNELTSVFEKENTKTFSQSPKDTIEFFDATTIFQNEKTPL